MSNLLEDHELAEEHLTASMAYRFQRADGVDVFYREAGPANAAVVLLLHGFPASSDIFRELIPRLATDYRVIAPDLPGFGSTRVPAERGYLYSFDALAYTAQTFMEALGLTQYALYVFDYSAPVAFRLAVMHPERVSAIVPRADAEHCFLNAPIDAWDRIRRYWLAPTAQNREAVLPLLTLDGKCWEVDMEVKDAVPCRARADWLDDYASLEFEGLDSLALDLLLLDYA